MDEQRFDALARAVSAGTSRRRVLGVLAGSLGAMLGGHPVTRAQGNSRNAKRCQKGGWQTLARTGDAAVPFTSEEECVSYGAQGGELVPVVTCLNDNQACAAEDTCCTASALCCPSGSRNAGKCGRLGNTGGCTADAECCSGVCAGSFGCCPVCPGGCLCQLPDGSLQQVCIAQGSGDECSGQTCPLGEVCVGGICFTNCPPVA
jgi:hypothetical protein